MYLVTETEADEFTSGEGTALGHSYDGTVSTRISNPDVENGFEVDAGPLDWFNSARMETNPDEDEVSFYISMGDPRGAFAFTVRRLPDGRIIMHTPAETDSLLHMPIKKVAPGTFEIEAA